MKTFLLMCLMILIVSVGFGQSSGGEGGAGGGVTSFESRTGAVTSASGDYSFSEVGGFVDLGTQVTGTLPVANGGTGSTSFTSGSVPYSNGTILTQNNSNLFWYNGGASLGLGTNNPVSRLHVDGKGRFVKSTHTWPTADAGGAWFLLRDSWVSAVDDSGLVAVAGMVRTSDKKWVATEGIGVAGAVIADNASTSATGLYSDVQFESGTYGFGLEVAVKNKTTNRFIKPYSGGLGTYGVFIQGGGDGAYGGAATNPSGAALVIGKNDTTWNSGIVIRSNAIEGADGSTGTGIAFDMAKGHIVNWRSTSDNQAFGIRSDVSTNGKDMAVVAGNDSVSIQGTGGATIARFEHQASALNYLTFNNRVTTSHPQISSAGIDANIGLELLTKGTGALRFTTNSAERVRIDGTGLGIGGTPANALDLFSGTAAGSFRIGADVNATTRTATTRKIGRVVFPNYTDAGSTPNVWMIGGDANGTQNYVDIGGSASASPYAATDIRLYTASTISTTGGTNRMAISSAGLVSIPGAGGGMDINSSGQVARVNGVAVPTPEHWQYAAYVDTVSRGNQTATIGATNLNNTATNGLYRVSLYIYPTTAGTSGTVTGTIAWNDGAAETATSAAHTFGALGTPVVLESKLCRVTNSTAITWATTVTANVGGVYEIDVIAERIW